MVQVSCTIDNRAYLWLYHGF